MRAVILVASSLLVGVAGAWAGDGPATVESNKTAIELVQTHAGSFPYSSSTGFESMTLWGPSQSMG